MGARPSFAATPRPCCAAASVRLHGCCYQVAAIKSPLLLVAVLLLLLLLPVYHNATADYQQQPATGPPHPLRPNHQGLRLQLSRLQLSPLQKHCTSYAACTQQGYCRTAACIL